MATLMTRKFKDEGGNTLYLRLVDGKRPPYRVRMQHGTGTGTLASAANEAEGVDRLDGLADDAVKRGWTEVIGRGGLTEIPEAIAVPLRQAPKGGARKSGRKGARS